MLRSLTVRDFAIVEAVEINLDSGLTVVSGETGAGKSLLVDALLLLSGARADSAAVRAGCERAELSARFDLSDVPAARDWLREQALDDEEGNECLLRRVIRREGPSRAWINGRPAANQTLAELAAVEPQTRVAELAKYRRLLYAYPWGEYLIWGFTGNVVRDLLEVLAGEPGTAYDPFDPE